MNRTAAIEREALKRVVAALVAMAGQASREVPRRARLRRPRHRAGALGRSALHSPETSRRHAEIFFANFLHACKTSPIIHVTALTGARVMNRILGEGGGVRAGRATVARLRESIPKTRAAADVRPAARNNAPIRPTPPR